MGGLKTFTDEEASIVDALAEQFQSNYKFYQFVKWMIGEGDLHFTFRTRQGYPCDIISTHALIPIDKNGELKETYGLYGHDAFEAIKKKIRLGMESWRHKLELGDTSMLEMHKDTIAGLGDLPWGVNSPVYGRQMQTASRAVLKESSGLWAEPKEPFYTHFEKNKDPEMAGRARVNIAKSFKVDPENFVIVHGHEPTYDAKKDDPNMSGIFKVLAGGTVINIDAGMAKKYGGKGGAIVFGTEGAAWLSYPALEFSRVPLPSDARFLMID
jgi:fructose-1,6-bisphosphatase